MLAEREIAEIQPFEKKIWLSSPTMHGPELEYITEAYRTNWMSTVGENINEAERLACEKVGCGYAVALSAGTAALHMAVKLAGVKPGDKVFCSDMTFDATVNPVVRGRSSRIYRYGIRHLEHGPGSSRESLRAVSGSKGGGHGPPLRNTRKDR